MDDGLKEHDPYKELKGAINEDRRPDFLKRERKGRDLDEAAQDLKSAEKAAGKDLAKTDDNLGAVKKNEENGGGLYSGGANSGKGQKKGGFKGAFRKGGPLGLIFLIVFGIGGLMGATQLFQPFSLLAQYQETFNSMHVSTNMRANRFFSYQMDSGRYKNPIRNKWTIFNGETFKISKKQRAKLAMQSIEYDDDFEGTGIRVLKFDDGSGEVKIVTADVASAQKIGDNAVDFRTIYAQNPDFFNGYNKGSMTWRGAIANCFGTITAKFLASNKLTRNLFDGFLKKVEAENNGNSKKVALDLMAKGTEDVGGGGYKTGFNQVDEEKMVQVTRKLDDGTEVTEWVPVLTELQHNKVTPGSTPNNDDYIDMSNESSSSFGKTKRTNLQTVADVRTKLDDIAGKVQKGANIACTIGNVIGAVSLLVTAAEAIQIIHLATGYFEAIDKVKAGYGDDSPIHDLVNALNDRKENTNVVLERTDYAGVLDSSDNITTGGIKALKTSKVTTTKSAMESSGVSSHYGGGAVNPDDPSVKSFNFTGNIKRILGGIGVSMAGFETCAIAKIVSNGVSALTSALEIAGCILGVLGAAFTFGISTAGCSALVGKIAKSIAFSVAIAVTVAAVISTITPIVANALMRDIVTDIGGEDLGNALTSGANMYLGNAHRSNGGSLSSKEKYVEYAAVQQQVIAENAKFERQTLDPFDITSKYTFMGTLLTQMMSLRSISSFMGALSSINTAVSSSIVAMSPTASAYNIAETLPESMEEYEKTCPYLASIGAVGDAFCNPYSMTDVSTMGYDPSLTVIEKLADDNSFLEEPAADGNVRINGKSDLAKYILFCDNRESAFGIADQNIVNQVSGWGSVQTQSSTFNNVTNGAIGAVPVIGDIVDVVQNSQALANIGYVSGESCVARGTTTATASLDEYETDAYKNFVTGSAATPNWNQAKYYQRFIEDQSLAESMGLIDQSAVTAFLDEYYEQNPLDNTYEGILARYSGLTKDTVVALLDIVDYGLYIADYHPEERYAFGTPAVEVDGELRFDNDNLLARDYFVLLNQISFYDVRNRSFAV